MFFGYVCGYSGENNLPVLLVSGITFSTPWILHGPMAAGIKNKTNKKRGVTVGGVGGGGEKRER